MASLLTLSPPGKLERFQCAATAVLALVLAVVIAIFIPAVLIGSMDIERLEVWDYLAMGFMMGFVGFLIWVAWSCRIGALPFRFTVDAQARKCGYCWGKWWTRQTDLSDTTRLRGEMFYTSIRAYDGKWRWSIYAVRREFEKGERIHTPIGHFIREDEAAADCKRILQALSEHLSLPAEFAADTATARR